MGRRGGVELIDLSSFPFAPLDHQILRIMVREATRAEDGGTVNWHGLTVGEVMLALGIKSTIENRGAVLKALGILIRENKGHKIRHEPRCAWRYFPSTRVVEHHAFGQVKLEGYV